MEEAGTTAGNSFEFDLTDDESYDGDTEKLELPASPRKPRPRDVRYISDPESNDSEYFTAWEEVINSSDDERLVGLGARNEPQNMTETGNLSVESGATEDESQNVSGDEDGLRRNETIESQNFTAANAPGEIDQRNIAAATVSAFLGEESLDSQDTTAAEAELLEAENSAAETRKAIVEAVLQETLDKALAQLDENGFAECQSQNIEAAALPEQLDQIQVKTENQDNSIQSSPGLFSTDSKLSNRDGCESGVLLRGRDNPVASSYKISTKSPVSHPKSTLKRRRSSWFISSDSESESNSSDSSDPPSPPVPSRYVRIPQPCTPNRSLAADSPYRRRVSTSLKSPTMIVQTKSVAVQNQLAKEHKTTSTIDLEKSKFSGDSALASPTTPTKRPNRRARARNDVHDVHRRSTLRIDDEEPGSSGTRQKRYPTRTRASTPNPNEAEVGQRRRDQSRPGVSPSKNFYSYDEKQRMIDWICSGKYHDRVMSMSLYEEMEAAQICPGRSKLSLNNVFRRSIIQALQDFRIKQADRKKLEKLENRRIKRSQKRQRMDTTSHSSSDSDG